MDIDQSGARIATGSYDYDVKLWDFGGMSSSFRPFKSFEPSGSYFVHDVRWAPAGDALLVVSGTAQAKVYTRDGEEPVVYKKGDVYIRDMKQTAGHVSELTSGHWHPHTRNLFLTSSTDSSIRLWDVEDRSRQKTVIVVKSKERGTRTRVLKAKFSPDGRHIGAVCHDGALHFWATGTNYTRPNFSIEGAHVRSTETSGLAWSRDNHTVATRGGPGDDTVKLWDMRNLKKALAVAEDVPNSHAETDVLFSLDERSVLTGSAAGRRTGDEDDTATGQGHIHLFSRKDLSLERKIPVTSAADGGPDGSVVRMQWHPKLNQLFCSTSRGSVHVYYSPTRSVRGALLCVDKAPRKRRDVEDFLSGEPQDGDAGGGAGDRMLLLPQGEDGRSAMAGRSAASKKRKLEKERKDGKATRMPERPLQGPGRGGRIGAAATQHVVQSIWKDTSREEDPREALLKYAAKEGEEAKFTGAWAKTQPKTIYRQVEEDEEERDLRSK